MCAFTNALNDIRKKKTKASSPKHAGKTDRMVLRFQFHVQWHWSVCIDPLLFQSLLISLPALEGNRGSWDAVTSDTGGKLCCWTEVCSSVLFAAVDVAVRWLRWPDAEIPRVAFKLEVILNKVGVLLYKPSKFVWRKDVRRKKMFSYNFFSKFKEYTSS